MRLTKLSLLTLIGSLAFSGATANAQAVISGTPTAVVYVDAVNGSNSNPGTATSPLRMIYKAVAIALANNNNGIGTKVVINPGLYREIINLQAGWKQTSAPMVFEAAQPGTAIVTGSDQLTGWIPESGNPAMYSSIWNYKFGYCTIPSSWPTFPAIGTRSELVFVNDVPLTQVLSLSDMREGTFNIDESNGLIHIWPSHDTDMNTAVVEASTRRQTMVMSGVNNVVIRGLVFTHAASCVIINSANVTRSSNVLFDNVQANWNNWGGLGASSSNQITIQNSVANHNGGVGIAGTMNKNMLYSNNETDYNNWRGAMAAFYDWAQGGTKVFTTHTATVLNQISYRNQAEGLWFDTDNKNITIKNATLAENVQAGLQVEVDEGPVSVSNSKFCSNGAGINVVNSSNLTVANNIFYNNGGTNKYQAEIFIAGKPGGRALTDWETGQSYLLFTTNMAINGNTVQNASPGQLVFGTYLSGSDWTTFTGPLVSDQNQWNDTTTTTSFKVPGIPGGKPVDLPGWQNNVRVDLNSVWVAPPSLASTCVIPNSSFPDFVFNSDAGLYNMVAGSALATLRVYSYGYGPVSLSVSGLPAGVTASFDQSTLTSGVANLTLTASNTAVAQTVPFTIFATSGSRVHSVTANLAVVPGP